MLLYCATTNRGKIREFRLAAAGVCELESLPGIEQIEPPEETGSTFRENAILKAAYYGAHTPGLLFAEDSGLVVPALGGAPGVHSARYAGEHASDQENNNLLLQRMRSVTDRRASFVCVIALVRGGTLVETFEGAVQGELLEAPAGSGGFGYDPLFFYRPFGCTLAEVDAARKLTVSHRGQALKKLFEFLRSRRDLA